MNPLAELLEKWRAEARTLDNYAPTMANVCRVHAAELQLAIDRAGAETLNLTEASQVSGYSERHLRDLLNKGEIPQAGRKGKPAIRRADLPRKPGSTAATDYDVDADANSLVDRMAS